MLKLIVETKYSWDTGNVISVYPNDIIKTRRSKVTFPRTREGTDRIIEMGKRNHKKIKRMMKVKQHYTDLEKKHLMLFQIVLCPSIRTTTVFPCPFLSQTDMNVFS